MHQDEIIRQLLEQNDQLKPENKLLKAKVFEIESLKERICELESRLAKYENAHKIAHYKCACCQKEVAAKDAGCPHEGKFEK